MRDAGHARRLARAATGLAVAYVLVALAAMWLHAPRVPYADGWRYIAVLADASFVDGILHVSNGHREVLPNLVRWLDLHLFDASQGLQIVVGMLLLLATLGVAWRALAGVAPAPRAGAWLVAAVGLCWLGNARALVHAQESVHAYLVTLSLVSGCWLLARAPRDAADAWRRGLLAGACGIVATFSFGSGIACFGAFVAVLWLRRAPWRDAVPVLLVALLATLLMAVAGLGGERIGVSPLLQGERLLRWLAAPSLYAAWPVFDPAIAARLPTAPARALIVPIAQGVAAVTGPADVARWPHLLTGTLGVAWLAVASLRCRRTPRPAVAVGLGIAWFGLGVGALIALARLGYFDLHPGQLLAMRYVVWSSLFWAGLGVAALAGARTTRATSVAIAIAVLLLPSQLWMWRFAERFPEVSVPVATAAVVGVLEPALPLGESVAGEVRAALPPLQAQRAAMYAWPESRWLGRVVPPETSHVIPAAGLSIVAVDNALDARAPGRRVTFVAPPDAAPRWLLQDADGVVRGIAIRDPLDGDRAIGWMRDATPLAPPRVVALRETAR